MALAGITLRIAVDFKAGSPSAAPTIKCVIAEAIEPRRLLTHRDRH